MANENDIPLNITADTEAAQKNLEQFTAAITKLMGSLNQSIENGVSKPLEQVSKSALETNKTLKSFSGFALIAASAAVVFDAGKKVIGFLEESVHKASEAEKVLSEFNFSLAASGSYSDEASKSLQEYASNLSKTTVFSSTAALESLTLAKNFGLTNQNALKLVDSAKELAAIQGITLQGATEKLLLTLNGQSRSVKDLGPQFAKLTEEQARAGVAIDLVRQKFHGAAEEMTNTFSGALAQASNQISGLKKTIGLIILDSPVFVNGIHEFTSALIELKHVISDNRDNLSSFVSIMSSAVSTIAGVAVQAVGRLFSGFLNLAAILDSAYRGIKGIGELLTGVFVSAAAKALQLVSAFSELASYLDILGKKFLIFGNKDLEAANKNTSDFSQEAIKASAGIQSITKSLTGVVTAFDKGGAASQKAANKFQQISDESIKSGGALGKLREEAVRFLVDLKNQSGDPFEKLVTLREEDLKKLNKYLKDGSLTYQEAADARVRIENSFSKKTKEIQDKDRKDAQAAIDKFNDDYAKSLEDRKKLIEGAFKDPIQAAINFDTSAGSAKEVGAAIGLGIVSEMLNGAKGAQKILSAGIGAAAEAFLPGFGGAIGQLADQLLTLGPDGAKAMVREFVDALPDLIIKLADAIPAVVEALVDSLINKGGIVRIAVALARAMSGEAVWRSIGKQIGTESTAVMVSGLSNFFSTLGQKISAAFQQSIPLLRQGIINGMLAGVGGITVAITNAIASGVQSVGPVIINAFSEAAGLLRSALSNFPSDIGAAISGAIRGIKFSTQIKLNVEGLVDGIKDGVRDALSGLPGAVADAIKGAVSFGGGGGGGGGILSGLGFATGGLVPPGYNNDTFPARLSSGELVIPKDLVGSLSDFLDVGLSPKKDNGDLNTAILGKIAALLGQPMNVESSINISGQAFADIILKLSRNNARLTA